MAAKGIRGIVTPAVTPFMDGELDLEGIAGLLEFLRRNGVRGVFPMGSTGAFSLFSYRAHAEVISRFSDALPPGMAFLPGVHRNDLEETISMARAAADAGADAVVVVTPHYLRFDQGALARYYSAVAGAVDVDVIAYNIPQLAGNSIGPSTLAAVMEEHDNLIGVKDSSGDVRVLQGYISGLPAGSLVYEGQDDVLYPALSMGASGGVCGTTNFSSLAQGIWSAHSSGSAEEALALHGKVAALMRALSGYQFPVPYYYLFQVLVMGRKDPSGYVPAPLVELSAEEEGRLMGEVAGALSGPEPSTSTSHGPR